MLLGGFIGVVGVGGGDCAGAVPYDEDGDGAEGAGNVVPEAVHGVLGEGEELVEPGGGVGLGD